MQIGSGLFISIPNPVIKNACYYIFNNILVTFQVVNFYTFTTYR
jgi:hypothetical protein